MRFRILLLFMPLYCCGCQSKAPTDSGQASAPPATAQEETMAADVKRLVTRIANATAGGEYDVVLDLTHPKALEASGGREMAIQQVKLGMAAIKERGGSFRVAGVGEPVLAKGTHAHYAVVPYTMAFSGPWKKGTSRTSVVGISGDGGRTWRFAQVSKRDGVEWVRRMFPDFPRDLTIPQTEWALEGGK